MAAFHDEVMVLFHHRDKCFRRREEIRSIEAFMGALFKLRRAKDSIYALLIVVSGTETESTCQRSDTICLKTPNNSFEQNYT